jgi:hypothetical protein
MCSPGSVRLCRQKRGRPAESTGVVKREGTGAPSVSHPRAPRRRGLGLAIALKAGSRRGRVPGRKRIKGLGGSVAGAKRTEETGTEDLTTEILRILQLRKFKAT